MSVQEQEALIQILDRINGFVATERFSDEAWSALTNDLTLAISQIPSLKGQEKVILEPIPKPFPSFSQVKEYIDAMVIEVEQEVVIHKPELMPLPLVFDPVPRAKKRAEEAAKDAPPPIPIPIPIVVVPKPKDEEKENEKDKKNRIVHKIQEICNSLLNKLTEVRVDLGDHMKTLLGDIQKLLDGDLSIYPEATKRQWPYYWEKRKAQLDKSYKEDLGTIESWQRSLENLKTQQFDLPDGLSEGPLNLPKTSNDWTPEWHAILEKWLRIPHNVVSEVVLQINEVAKGYVLHEDNILLKAAFEQLKWIQSHADSLCSYTISKNAKTNDYETQVRGDFKTPLDADTQDEIKALVTILSNTLGQSDGSKNHMSDIFIYWANLWQFFSPMQGTGDEYSSRIKGLISAFRIILKDGFKIKLALKPTDFVEEPMNGTIFLVSHTKTTGASILSMLYETISKMKDAKATRSYNSNTRKTFDLLHLSNFCPIPPIFTQAVDGAGNISININSTQVFLTREGDDICAVSFWQWHEALDQLFNYAIEGGGWVKDFFPTLLTNPKTRHDVLNEKDTTTQTLLSPAPSKIIPEIKAIPSPRGVKLASHLII